jgi:hypothetical protein
VLAIRPGSTRDLDRFRIATFRDSPLALVRADPLADRVVRDAVLAADGEETQSLDLSEKLLVRGPLDSTGTRTGLALAIPS